MIRGRWSKLENQAESVNQLRWLGLFQGLEGGEEKRKCRRGNHAFKISLPAPNIDDGGA